MLKLWLEHICDGSSIFYFYNQGEILDRYDVEIKFDENFMFIY